MSHICHFLKRRQSYLLCQGELAWWNFFKYLQDELAWLNLFRISQWELTWFKIFRFLNQQLAWLYLFRLLQVELAWLNLFRILNADHMIWDLQVSQGAADMTISSGFSRETWHELSFSEVSRESSHDLRSTYFSRESLHDSTSGGFSINSSSGDCNLKSKEYKNTDNIRNTCHIYFTFWKRDNLTSLARESLHDRISSISPGWAGMAQPRQDFSGRAHRIWDLQVSWEKAGMTFLFRLLQGELARLKLFRIFRGDLTWLEIFRFLQE